MGLEAMESVLQWVATLSGVEGHGLTITDANAFQEGSKSWFLNSCVFL